MGGTPTDEQAAGETMSEVTQGVAGQFADPVAEQGEADHFWTRTNAGEASPEILTPLAWTLWRDQLALALRRAFSGIGPLDPDDLHVVTTTDEPMVGCFHGQGAANIVHVVERVPHTSGAEWKEKMQGRMEASKTARRRADFSVPRLPHCRPASSIREAAPDDWPLGTTSGSMALRESSKCCTAPMCDLSGTSSMRLATDCCRLGPDQGERSGGM
jgi:hypothetical protein